ncbi:MAG: hypothetical protein ACJA2O_000083 [Candidatus Azotimanducaceae bacterium]|jgi:hypothetical protein
MATGSKSYRPKGCVILSWADCIDSFLDYIRIVITALLIERNSVVKSGVTGIKLRIDPDQGQLGRVLIHPSAHFSRNPLF